MHKNDAWSGLFVMFALGTAGCGLLKKEEGSATASTSSTSVGASSSSSSSVSVGGSGGSAPASDWQEINSGTDVLLDAVWSAGGVVIAVGAAGTIVRSPDAGASWTTVDSGVTVDLSGVWHDAMSVYVVGAQGTILYSGDGGQSFEARDAGVTADLTAVWGLGNGEVLVTGPGAGLYDWNDQSQMWSQRSTSSFTAIWGLSATDLYAISDRYVRQSDDAGVSWTSMLGSYAMTPHQDVWAFSDNYILSVSGYGTLFTYDGSWSYSIPFNDRDLHGIWGSATNNVFVVGDGGSMMRSASQEKCGWIDTQLDLYDVHGSDGRVYVVGAAGTVWLCDY